MTRTSKASRKFWLQILAFALVMLPPWACT